MSVGFDKHAEIEGCLAGIKGQHLIFDDNRELNIRKQRLSHHGRLTVKRSTDSRGVDKIGSTPLSV